MLGTVDLMLIYLSNPCQFSSMPKLSCYEHIKIKY
jgi:hypothetical protein